MPSLGSHRERVAARRLRWAALVFDLNLRGHEQGGERRALVVSYEPFHGSGLLTICPVTAARSVPRYPNEVPVPRGEAGQTEDGLILCHQVRTVSLQRLSGQDPRILGYLADAATRTAVRAALANQLGLTIDGLADGASTSDRFH